MYTLYQCLNLATVTTEGFADASVPTNVDTNNAIATLAQIATDLQSNGGVKVPGNLIAQNDIWMRKNPSESDKYAVRVGGMYDGGGITSARGSPLELFGDNKEVFIGSSNGSAPKNNLTVTGSARINKFYKGSQPNSDGIEFLHDNGSQGIGLGYNTIYATGTNTDVNLGLQAKGTGKVVVNGDLSIGNGTHVLQPGSDSYLRLLDNNGKYSDFASNNMWVGGNLITNGVTIKKYAGANTGGYVGPFPIPAFPCRFEIMVSGGGATGQNTGFSYYLGFIVSAIKFNGFASNGTPSFTLTPGNSSISIGTYGTGNYMLTLEYPSGGNLIA